MTEIHWLQINILLSDITVIRKFLPLNSKGCLFIYKDVHNISSTYAQSRVFSSLTLISTRSRETQLLYFVNLIMISLSIFHSCECDGLFMQPLLTKYSKCVTTPLIYLHFSCTPCKSNSSDCRKHYLPALVLRAQHPVLPVLTPICTYRVSPASKKQLRKCFSTQSSSNP